MKRLIMGPFSLMLITGLIQAQSLPVGTPVLESYYRTKQLLGELDSTISFTVRPVFTSLKFKNIFDPDSSLTEFNPVGFGAIHSIDKKIGVQLLPLFWQQQYNYKSPYSWNDAAMIPARGYQTMISGGFFAKMGLLSIQLRPEFVYAQNKDYDILDIYSGAPDLPAKFGNRAYSKAGWGQSSIRLNFRSLSLGLSSENLWWGPGMRNSLLMSNNAPGFKHLTFNTNRPLQTSVGFLEFQIIAGKLEGSGYSYLDNDPIYSDWRYLAAFVVTYQPKWVPGLFLGLTRAFQDYHEDLARLYDYIPFFTPYQKANTKQDSAGSDGKDQLTSVFARWVFSKAHAEIYFEYGANDNAYNLRDFIGSPEHSRAYIFGLSKLVKLKIRKNEYVKVNAEITQMSQSIDRLVRGAGAWYYHGQILQGYTHKGEVLGAGVGPGGNVQSLDLSWVKGVKSLGLQIERYVHNDDYYYTSVNDLNDFSRKWVDMSVAAHSTWNYKNLLVNAKIQLVNSLNYQWKLRNYVPNTYYIPENDMFNLHAELGLTYRF